MKRNLLLPKTLAVFLNLALGLPIAVHPESFDSAVRPEIVEGYALRQAGLEENAARDDFVKALDTDARILAAIDRLKARTPPVAITQSAIAAEAEVNENTVTHRKQANSAVAAAIEAAALTDADARILAAIDRLKARTPPVAITRSAIAAEAEVSEPTVTHRKQANSAVAAAIEAARQTAAGVEESWMQSFLDILEEAEPQGLGMLVIEAEEISRRTGLEEFIARIPRRLGEKILLFGEGSIVIQELAARNGVAVVTTDRLSDLAFRLAGMEEANRIGYLGDPVRAASLARILPASMPVTPMAPGATLDQMLGYLGYPDAVSEEIDAAGLEDLFVQARAA